MLYLEENNIINALNTMEKRASFNLTGENDGGEDGVLEMARALEAISARRASIIS